MKVLPAAWYDGLARILIKVEEVGVWPDGLLDAYIATISKTDGDAAPFGQRPLCVLPVVYRIWASARMGQLESWLGVGCLIRFLVLVVVVGRWKRSMPLLWISRIFLLIH